MNTHFERSIGHDEYLTPPEIIKALGEFDLDPCAPIDRPWPTAKNHFTTKDDGLSKSWTGRVWCNPPYGKQLEKWLGRCADHGNAIALTFARTETKCFFSSVWGRASAIMFMKGRIQFYSVQGVKVPGNPGSPSVLIAYNKDNAERLKKSGLSGFFVELPI